jgi:hypothetical protein
MARSRTWVFGYIRGSVAGYRRGTVSLRRVTASVLMAIGHGLTIDEVSPLLGEYGLQWASDRNAVVPVDSTLEILLERRQPAAIEEHLELASASLAATTVNALAALTTRRRELHDILDAERRRLPQSPDWIRGGMKTHIDILEQLIEETEDRLRQTLREGAGARVDSTTS